MGFMECVRHQVRFGELCRPDLLKLSSSEFDPTRTIERLPQSKAPALQRNTQDDTITGSVVDRDLRTVNLHHRPGLRATIDEGEVTSLASAR
jgi:hypothetical protein